MNELLTVANLFNGLVLVVAWSIKQELGHIRSSIEDAKDSASEAHKRLDVFLLKKPC